MNGEQLTKTIMTLGGTMASVIVPHRHGNRNGNNGSRREVRLQSCRMKGFPFGLFLQPPWFLLALYYIVLEFDLLGGGEAKDMP